MKDVHNTGSEQASCGNAHYSESEKIVVRRALTCSFLGNFAEWLDYGSYAYLATIIAVVFFPEGDSAIKLMSTYAVFALSFVARPIGAFVWGYLGDKKGRKWSLTVSILLMTGATSAIGLIPSFNSIGYTAPILLLILRMVQGFSAAAEYAGAAVFVAEYAPSNKRGLYCSMIPASTAAGLLVGSFLVTILNVTMTPAMMESFGWRIPFLIAFPLGVVVLRMWLHLEDSEIYNQMVKKMTARGEKRESPLYLIFTKYLRPTVISFGVASLNAVGFYMVLTYLPVYVETVVKIDKVAVDVITNITLLGYIAMIFFAGKLSDYFGRKKMLIAACLGFIILLIPGYLLLNTQVFWVILAVNILLAFILTLNDGTLSSFLSETFPTEVRYSGFAVSFNLANAIFGGTVGLVSTFIIKETGNPLSPAFYMVGVSVFALVCMFFAKEYKDKELK